MRLIRTILKNQRGISLAELMISIILGGIVGAAGLEFYVTQHRSWLMEQEVSDVQYNARNCLDEIASCLKMAGFGLTDHPAYTCTSGHLSIYSKTGADVDTLQFLVVPREGEQPLLLCKEQGQDPQVYADGIEDLTVTEISPGLLQVRLVCRAEKQEGELVGGDGYRRRELTTEVRARNYHL